MSVWHPCVAVILSCVVLAGCGDHALDVGSNDAGAAQDGATFATVNPFADASPTAAQVWSGHFENYQLPDGSDALTMTLEFAAGGKVTGSLLLGDGALLQPPSDPSVGYPPGAQFSLADLVEGFPYTILDGSLSGSHLTFQVAEYEVWTTWCALQTSYLTQASDSGAFGSASDVYECVPAVEKEIGPTGCFLFDSMTMSMSPIDCGKLALCTSETCQCSAIGCQVNPSPNPDIVLDLVLAATTADGTTSGTLGSYAVQFTRTR
jgi:hypothetical protein